MSLLEWIHRPRCCTVVVVVAMAGCGRAGFDALESDAGEQLSGTAFVTVPSGTFVMGSPSNEACRRSNETQHQVTLTRGFAIQRAEATQREFELVMGYKPSTFDTCGVDCPVESVSWHEAAAFCNALSVADQHAPCYACAGRGPDVRCVESEDVYTCTGFRLPTEAEWERAYRAGTTSALYNGELDGSLCDRCSPIDMNLDRIGWYCGNFGNVVHAVAQKQPNAWGLYDMAGGVFEWVHDRAVDDLGSAAATNPVGAGAGSRRIIRSGIMDGEPFLMRAAFRHDVTETSRGSGLGFRCARTL